MYLTLEILTNSQPGIIIFHSGVKVYSHTLVKDLIFQIIKPRWNFEIKELEVQKMKKFLKIDDNNMYSNRFTITKLMKDMIQLYSNNEIRGWEFKICLPIVDKLDDYFENNFPICYNIKEITKIFSLTKDNDMPLIITIDYGLEMLIECYINSTIRIC